MNDALSTPPSQPSQKKKIRWVTPLIVEVLLLYVLVIGGVFCFVGITWGGGEYLHPDEGFLVGGG